jgi:hypothetical protein
MTFKKAHRKGNNFSPAPKVVPESNASADVLPRVAVSYAWKEERGGTSALAVETFCEQLRANGIEVIRDKDRVRHGESLSEFMQSIGASDRLCVFLSQDYLRSQNCMYELLVAWNRSKDNPKEFRSRVMVWVMPGAEGIRSMETRLQTYATFWRNERDRLAALVKEHVTEVLSSASQAEYRRAVDITNAVDEILAFIADQLVPRSMNEFADWVRSVFPNKTIAEAADRLVLAAQEDQICQTSQPALPKFRPLTEIEADLRRVFGKQLETASAILDGNLILKQKLAAKYGVGQSDHDTARRLTVEFGRDFLEAIGKFDVLYRDTDQKEVLLRLVSTVIYFAICPDVAIALASGNRAPRDIIVERTAQRGIAEILICWTQRKEHVPLRTLTNEKSLGLYETTPQMSFYTLKRQIVEVANPGSSPPLDDRLDIEVERAIRENWNFETPLHITLTDMDKELLEQIRSPNSPTSDLLVFIQKIGASINPNVADFDLQFERHLARFLKTIA